MPIAQESRKYREKKKKKKGNGQLSICKCTWVFLSIKQHHFLFSVFSPFWKENVLMVLEKKHPGLTIYFPFSPSNQWRSHIGTQGGLGPPKIFEKISIYIYSRVILIKKYYIHNIFIINLK